MYLKRLTEKEEIKPLGILSPNRHAGLDLASAQLSRKLIFSNLKHIKD
jgi:hypothetical protein